MAAILPVDDANDNDDAKRQSSMAGWIFLDERSLFEACTLRS
jgi:hypothetical protein